MARTPRRHAVAIRGVDDDRVSTSIAARGAGKLADEIIALAREHGIPVKEDPDLVGLLAKLDLEEVLPPELHALVAELIGFAYHLNRAAESGDRSSAERDGRPAAESGDGSSPESAGIASDSDEAASGPAAPPGGGPRVSVEPGEAELDDLPPQIALPPAEDDDRRGREGDERRGRRGDDPRGRRDDDR